MKTQAKKHCYICGCLIDHKEDAVTLGAVPYPLHKECAVIMAQDAPQLKKIKLATLIQHHKQMGFKRVRPYVLNKVDVIPAEDFEELEVPFGELATVYPGSFLVLKVADDGQTSVYRMTKDSEGTKTFQLDERASDVINQDIYYQVADQLILLFESGGKNKNATDKYRRLFEASRNHPDGFEYFLTQLNKLR